MPSIKDKDKDKELANSVIVDSHIPTHYVDRLMAFKRSDDMYLLRFLCKLPESMKEEVRCMTTSKNLRNFVDAICSTTGYYPKPENKSD